MFFASAHTIILFKDSFRFISGNAYSEVSHGKKYAIVICYFCCNMNSVGIWRIFYGIANKIAHHLRNPVAVTIDISDLFRFYKYFMTGDHLLFIDNFRNKIIEIEI